MLASVSSLARRAALIAFVCLAAIACGPPEKPTIDVRAAARDGNMEEVRSHIHWKSDLNEKGIRGFTALHYAIAYDHEEVVKALVDAGADVNAEAQEGLRPLHLAGTSGNLEIAKMLVEKGAKLNVISHENMTPYQLTIVYKHPELQKFLKSKGADTTIRKFKTTTRTASPAG